MTKVFVPNYEVIPGISTIISDNGTGAILKVNSTNIGKIQKVKFNSHRIGFDYPTDETLRPIAILLRSWNLSL